MIHNSIRDGEEILECGQCGHRCWIDRGTPKVVCPKCGHLERIPPAESAAPKTAAKPAPAAANKGRR